MIDNIVHSHPGNTWIGIMIVIAGIVIAEILDKIHPRIWISIGGNILCLLIVFVGVIVYSDGLMVTANRKVKWYD